MTRPHFRVLTLMALVALALFFGSQKITFADVDPVADYRFNNSLASSVGTAPALTTLGTNSYEVDEVDGTDCNVLAFPSGNGLQLSTNGLIASDNYSLVILFRFDEVSGYRKIADFTNGTQDYGLYVLSSNLRLYSDAVGTGEPIAADTYVQVVLTRNGTTDQTTGYVNGAQAFQFDDTSNHAVIDSSSTLRFLLDDELTQSEESGGAVARIRLYNDVLSAGAVAALDTTHSECGIVPTFQDSGIQMNYSGWYGLENSGASGGSVRASSTAGAKAQTKFTGTAVTLHYLATPNNGKADIYIDKVKVKSLCMYSASTTAKSKKFKNLANSKHKFEVRVTGQTCGGGSEPLVTIDKLVAEATTLEDTAAQWKWNGWTNKNDAAANGGTYRQSAMSGAYVEFYFSGTSIDILTLEGPAFGKMTVHVDDETFSPIDLNAAVLAPRVVTISSFSPGPHLITLTRDGSSGNKPIVIDGFRGDITSP